jgi:CHASE1-domain containing sensor protein/two-component sensor histidine kinase
MRIKSCVPFRARDLQLDRRLRKYFPALVFVAIAFAGLAMATFAYLSGEEAARIKFEATADDALSRIESRVSLNLALLRATEAYFETRNGDVSAAEFKVYFDTLQVEKNFEGLEGLGMLGMGPAAEFGALNQELVRRQGAGAEIFPAVTDAEWRTPLMLYEAIGEQRRSVLGFDMFSEAPRREAMLAAIATGEPRASRRLMLGQRTGDEIVPGFLIFSAVERAKRPEGVHGGPVTDGQAPAALVFATFRASDLFSKILDKFPPLPAHAEVFDGAIDAANLIFRSEKPVGGELVTTRQLLVAGRPWTIEFRPTAEFTMPTSQVVPILLGLFGLLLAVAMAFLQYYQSRAYDAVATLQETSEKSLLEKDLMLQEMKHRIKNSITRVLAISRQTAAGAKDVKEFSESFGARLQAMAASQDMLTRSRWQKADLAELLRIELSQAFGKDLPAGTLDGPKVLLPETVTQALGLTFHELATNALKYGEVGMKPDALTVNWQLDYERRSLVLLWKERGSSAVEAPAQAGFGTKLIDLNVERELNGRIRRNYRPDGLDIEIEVPLRG